MITSVQWQQGGRSNRAEAEVLILESYLDKLQKVFATQSKALIGLEGELDLFRDTLNQRLDFYRELQQISDQVAPLQEELSEQVDRIRLAGEQSIEDSHLMRLAAFKTKRRFLIHLRAESSGNEEERICIICQSSFEIGVLTICGHRFCKQCTSPLS
jgi:E3 ubiquitin-protein ligase SHPRH